MPLFTRSAPPETKARDSIIEMVFAGNALREYLVTRRDRTLTECVCGVTASDTYDPDSHHAHCPVARFDAAVERVRKEAL